MMARGMQALTYHTRIHQPRKPFLSRIGKRGSETGTRTLTLSLYYSRSKACWPSRGTSRPCFSKAKWEEREEREREKGGTLIVVATALYVVGHGNRRGYAAAAAYRPSGSERQRGHK